MKERPILFSAPMVRAIHENRKRKTRRIVKHEHVLDTFNHVGSWQGIEDQWQILVDLCPYGRVGDRLWVREAWAAPHKFDPLPPRLISHDARMHYAATEKIGGLRGRPSIHMPRWASRITLEITHVHVERLKDISDDDCYDEGIESWLADDDNLPKYADGTPAKYNNIKQAFRVLWESINGPGSWDANPWVWVIEFKTQ